MAVSEPPRGINHLKALHTLGAVNINTADGMAIMDEIESLDQLKKLDISGITRKTGIKLLSKVIPYRLESLSLRFEKDNHDFTKLNSFLFMSVRSLKLYGHVDKTFLSNFWLPPPELMKLSIEMSTLFTQEDIELMGSLLRLRTLRLRVKKDQDGELQFPSALFSKLQDLEITCKSKLHVKFDGAMEKLELLKIHCCQGSSMQFSGLEHLASLKQVFVQGSLDDALKEALRQQVSIHPKQPFLRLEEADDAERSVRMSH
ncbi:hypothetical protein ACP4OV_008892 [Aristida adscensionis]